MDDEAGDFTDNDLVTTEPTSNELLAGVAPIPFSRVVADLHGRLPRRLQRLRRTARPRSLDWAQTVRRQRTQ